MKWGGGGRSEGTLSGVPYPTELKWKVGVKWGGDRSEHWVGYLTAPYPTEFKWAIKLIKK